MQSRLITPEEKNALMLRLSESIMNCKKCGLCTSRKIPVVGEGPLDADIVFVGEGPGADEDQTGHPFVGKAGQLLDKIFKAAHIGRDKIYITNVVKCRPPGNRAPAIEEVLSCQRFMEAQIALINPRIIVSMGNTPTKWFLGSGEGITRVRGKWFKWRGIDLMPIFHPSYLLRNESRKKDGPKALTWGDFKEIKKRWDNTQRGEI